jgi:hypothetical protein
MVKSRGREVWPWWKRAPIRCARWGYNILFGPFLTKLPDGTVQASMTRISVAAFTVVECWRLVPQDGPGQMRLVPVIGWPDAFLALCILFALPIDAALSKAKPAEVLGFLRSPFSRTGDAVEAGAAVTTTLEQQITPADKGEGDV